MHRQVAEVKRGPTVPGCAAAQACASAAGVPAPRALALLVASALMHRAAACSCWPHTIAASAGDTVTERRSRLAPPSRLAAAAWAGLALPSCFQTTHLPKQRLWQTLGQAQTRTHWSSSFAAAKAAAQQEGVRRNQGSCQGPDLPYRKH